MRKAGAESGTDRLNLQFAETFLPANLSWRSRLAVTVKNDREVER
jgi:hypothetical protein